MASGRIPDEIIRAIRDRTDLAELIGRYVSLKQVGRNWKGLCPFHREKTPSFHVHVERQIFHCFGCQVGGDAFAFLTLHDNLTFPEAVRQLAAAAGVSVPETREAGEAGLAERIYAANEIAQTHYRACLASPQGAGARAYLEGRGLDAQTVEAFGIGFASDRWDGVAETLSARGVSAEIGERAGLLVSRRTGGHYDRLRGRVIFPIRDARGRIVAFGGRALGSDQEPKYLNTSESPVYRKRESFYGLPASLEPMRRTGRAVVVEGYFDLLALHRAGVQEVLATCGTALTPDHARALRRRTRNAVLLFDGDAAGQRAVESALEVLLPEGLRVSAALLPAGEDPDTFLAARGAEALRELVEQAPPALEVFIRRAAATSGATPWQKSDAVGAVARLIARVPEPLERDEHARRLALSADAEVEAVRATVAAAQGVSRGVSPGDEEAPAPQPARRQAAGPEVRWLRGFAQVLLAHPGLAAELDRAELAELLPEGPSAALVAGLLDAAQESATAGAGGSTGAPDLAALCERLSDEAAAELRALAVGEAVALERPQAERVARDTLERLRRAKRQRESNALTRQLRDASPADVASLLALKDRQLKERGGQARPRSDVP